MRLRIAPTAEADLDEIWLYLARETGNLVFATEIVESITDKFGQIAKFPFMGRSRKVDLGSDKRSFPVGDHIIFYRVRQSEIQIMRILHGSRNAEAILEEE